MKLVIAVIQPTKLSAVQEALDRLMKNRTTLIIAHRLSTIQHVDTVITVCGNADQVCPAFPGQVRRHHWGFDDPAHAIGAPEQVRAEFRRVRDEIRRVFEAYAAGLRDAQAPRSAR